MIKSYHNPTIMSNLFDNIENNIENNVDNNIDNNNNDIFEIKCLNNHIMIENDLKIDNNTNDLCLIVCNENKFEFEYYCNNCINYIYVNVVILLKNSLDRLDQFGCHLSIFEIWIILYQFVCCSVASPTSLLFTTSAYFRDVM